MTSFTPGSTDTPLAGPTHSTGPAEELGDGLADGLAVALGVTAGLALGIGVGVGVADALTLGLALGESVTDGLALIVSAVDGLPDGDGPGDVSSEPVRASNVTSVAGEGDGSDAGD